MTGIALQALGLGTVWFGPSRVALAPGSPAALLMAIAVLLLMLVAVGLFVWARRTMARNWSIVARTRADHRSVEDGPFRYVRHPIYSGIFLLVPATALALGHAPQMLIGVPLYAIGTLIRARIEEAMLRASFGAEHDRYAARVRRFVPGVF